MTLVEGRSSLEEKWYENFYKHLAFTLVSNNHDLPGSGTEGSVWFVDAIRLWKWGTVSIWRNDGYEFYVQKHGMLMCVCVCVVQAIQPSIILLIGESYGRDPE